MNDFKWSGSGSCVCLCGEGRAVWGRARNPRLRLSLQCQNPRPMDNFYVGNGYTAWGSGLRAPGPETQMVPTTVLYAFLPLQITSICFAYRTIYFIQTTTKPNKVKRNNRLMIKKSFIKATKLFLQTRVHRFLRRRPGFIILMFSTTQTQIQNTKLQEIGLDITRLQHGLQHV